MFMCKIAYHQIGNKQKWKFIIWLKLSWARVQACAPSIASFDSLTALWKNPLHCMYLFTLKSKMYLYWRMSTIDNRGRPIIISSYPLSKTTAPYNCRQKNLYTTKRNLTLYCFIPWPLFCHRAFTATELASPYGMHNTAPTVYDYERKLQLKRAY